MIDTNSEAWLALRKHIETEIELSRESLEAMMDSEQTAKLRGEIYALRRLIKWAEPEEITDVPKDTNYMKR